MRLDGTGASLFWEKLGTPRSEVGGNHPELVAGKAFVVAERLNYPGAVYPTSRRSKKKHTSS